MASSTISADAAALDRVLMRVAGTDEANLEAVLDRLLPLVIAKLDTEDPQVKGGRRNSCPTSTRASRPGRPGAAWGCPYWPSPR